MLAVFSNTLQADFVINLSSDNGTIFSDNFDVQVGESLNLSVFLQQSSPDTILFDEGLASFGLDLSSSSTSLGTISNPMVNPVFDFQNHNVATISGFEWEYAAGTSATGDSILLGSFQFESSAVGTTNFIIADRNPGSGPLDASWVTPGFTQLDEQIFGMGAADTFQFSVNATSAVPEPSSLALLTCAGVVGLLRWRKKALATKQKKF